MFNFIYAPAFVRKFNKLEKDLQDEALEKINLFKDKNNHKILKIHKLHGRLQDRHSLYVNYKTRIIFVWEGEQKVVFLTIGDHDIYKN